jgi:hypothetical protein
LAVDTWDPWNRENIQEVEVLLQVDKEWGNQDHWIQGSNLDLEWLAEEWVWGI